MKTTLVLVSVALVFVVSAVSVPGPQTARANPIPVLPPVDPDDFSAADHEWVVSGPVLGLLWSFFVSTAYQIASLFLGPHGWLDGGSIGPA